MKEITVYVNGKPVQVPEGASAATAINKAGERKK
jgi:sulfur carrier protein ThiS